MKDKIAGDYTKMKSVAGAFSKLKKITPSKLKNRFTWEIANIMDFIWDKKITGRNLTRTISSPITLVRKGGLDSQPARYLILEKVFSHISLSSSDSFMDVGCGQGRVLAFLVLQKCPCEIYGVEFNETAGKTAIEWTKKNPNIHVILGDAFSLDYNEYTVLFLSQPFSPYVFSQFILYLESHLIHPVTLIYLFDRLSGGHLEGRNGWELQYWEEFYKIKGFQVVGAVNRFSIWRYTPSKSKSQKRD